MIKRKQYKALVPSLVVEFDRENDGRWIAEVPKLPGVMAYGNTKQEALRHVYAIALRALADGVEHGTRSTPTARLLGRAISSR